MPGRQLAALVVVFAVATGSAQVARAQATTLNVSALVLQPVTVVGSRNLAFGDVFPGVNKTIPVQGGNSGRFQVTGEVNAPISLTFTLPANLANGTNLLPIGSWVGRHNTTSNAATGVAFTPSGTATNTTLSAAGIRWVYISGTVMPSANQAAGGYIAIATLTVAYL